MAPKKPSPKAEAWEKGSEKLQSKKKGFPKKNPIEAAWEAAEKVEAKVKKAKGRPSKAKEKAPIKIAGAAEIPRLVRLVNGISQKPTTKAERQQAAAKLRNLARQVEVGRGDYVVGTNAAGERAFIEKSKDGSSIRIIATYPMEDGQRIEQFIVQGSESKFDRNYAQLAADYEKAA